jgi:3-oxoacyl-[acyl-carrier protein] reductase
LQEGQIMDLKIAGRNAVVLASTAGLGLATARQLAREGVNVVLCGRRGDLAVALAAELGSAIGLAIDLRDPTAAVSIMSIAERELGNIDILVLNGPGPVARLASETPAEAVAEALQSLFLAQVRVVQAALPGMRSRGWGRILAIGSSGIVSPIPNLAASNSGRAALAGYLKTLAGEVAQDGVTVNMLLPGRIATERVSALDEFAAERTNRTVEDVAAASRATIPAGRYGTPEEFADIAAFLCSSRAGYITGSQIRCDGGLIRAH